MFFVSSKRGSQFGVTDTKDGVEQFYTSEQLSKIKKKYNINIVGFQGKDVIVLGHEPFRYPLMKLFRGLGVRVDLDYKPRWGIEFDLKDGTAAVRDWGNWVLPEDADCDEEDYDWKELSEKSYRELKRLLDSLNKEYPYFKFSCDIGEKSWIYFTISERRS